MNGWATVKPSWVIAGVLIIIVLLVCCRYPRAVRGRFYAVFRDCARISLELQTRGYQQAEGKHFRVKYLPRDADIVDVVLEAAEKVYEPVNDALGFSPRGKVPIVVYPSGEELANCFGWPSDQGALGAYWVGTIRVLSPKAWIGDESRFSDRFWEAGPMAHEYTHFVVDYITRGNCPRWLTEGLAQWEDRELTGFVFDFYSEEMAAQKPYRLEQLDRDFDDQPCQMLAYWQSLAAIEFIDKQYSINKVKELINRLGEGYNQEVAFKTTFGITFDEFESSYQIWLQENIPSSDSLKQVAAARGST